MTAGVRAIGDVRDAKASVEETFNNGYTFGLGVSIEARAT